MGTRAWARSLAVARPRCPRRARRTPVHVRRADRRPRAPPARAAAAAHTGGVAALLAAPANLPAFAASFGDAFAAAHPGLYFAYLMGAGVGLPFSEDALCVWLGSVLAAGVDPGRAASVLLAVYAGVVVSDMLTFGIGVALRMGLLERLKRVLMRDDAVVERATRVVQERGALVGFAQRFMLGFRGPMCIFAGFTGVKPGVFALGASCGAVLSFACQLALGYVLHLRGVQNVYLVALAAIGLPNAIGHVVGPLVTVFGGWWAARRQGKSDAAQTGGPEEPRPVAATPQ